MEQKQKYIPPQTELVRMQEPLADFNDFASGDGEEDAAKRNGSLFDEADENDGVTRVGFPLWED